MALHTGDMEAEGEDYRGPALHRASRMLIAARGGQILLSDATAGLIRRDLSKEIRLVDLGVYRLRDVPTPERLYQVEYPGMATAAFPPLSAEAGYRSHLPAQVNRFFGREREIALLRELLLPTLDPLPKREGATAPTPDLLPKRDGAATAHPPSRFGKGAGGLGPAPSRLITLSGPGGTGKTRLALEVAERLSESYHGAVWFVGLGDLADSSLIGGAILDALRVPRSPQRDAVDQVVETLAHQPSLLVLDNYEHLVDDGAVLVRTLLGRVPSLTVLVTSRKLLGLAGEQEFAVSPLSTPNGGETAEQLSLYDSVALFVDRAQSAMPHFQVTTHNAPAVAELCQRLEGIPLALELAAARALVLTPTQMLSQLEQRFEFLVSRKRDATERHRTLQAAVDWSYRLLSPELQRSFARLSVFRGGWTVEAAEAVCEEPLALDYLAQLRECSLVLTDEAGSEMRFRMLETLREYASERLSAADQGAVQQRHRDYFLRLAEEAKEKLIGPDQGVSLNKLEVEHDNLRLALTFCVEEPKGAETGLRLSAALWKFWETRGHLREGQERLIALLSLPLAQEHTNARAAALNAAGVLCRRQGDYAAAQALHEESLAISRELGDLQGIANSLNDLGSVARAKSDYISARSLHEEGLDLFRKLGDRPGIAACLNNLGNVAKDQCDYSNARSLFEESLAIQRQLGNRHAIATSLGNLGIVAEKVSDYASARSLYGQCLAIFRELGSKWGIAAFVHNLGVVAREQKDFASAYSLFQEALIINREIGNRAWEANNLCCLGNVATDMGDYASARLLHQEALAISRALGDRSAVAASLGNQGMLAYLQGDYASARALFEAALVIVREIGNRAWEAWNLQNIGCVTTAQGDHISARPQYVESLQIYRDLGDRQGVASSLEAFAGLNAREDRLEPAARIWSAAERLREEIGAPIHPVNRQEYDREAAAARKALGDEAFTAAWAAGRGMTWEEAVAYALDEAAS
ncbi:MAG TPA: tetratricopeptide repeat protein [Acidobacteriaceae bacterium]|nr:tetratricopeptide repeat protein [Acidobacteriaceae bacterium]